MVKGLTPEIFAAPQAFAELTQRAASIEKAFNRSPIVQIAKQMQNNIDAAAKVLQPAIKQLVKAGKFIAAQFIKAFAKAKDFFKQKLVKFLPIALPLFKIPRAQIQPSSGKSLQLPNSYRSHSPPFSCVIV